MFLKPILKLELFYSVKPRKIEMIIVVTGFQPRKRKYFQSCFVQKSKLPSLPLPSPFQCSPTFPGSKSEFHFRQRNPVFVDCLNIDILDAIAPDFCTHNWIWFLETVFFLLLFPIVFLAKPKIRPN